MGMKYSVISANISRQPVPGSKFILSPCAEAELGAIWARIATDDPDEATRVIEAAGETFAALARAPEFGRLRRFRGSGLKDIRSWHISGLDNYLVFYRIVPEGIQILHVCYGARDIEVLRPVGDEVAAETGY
jgi:toxin ParE1/3/4